MQRRALAFLVVVGVLLPAASASQADLRSALASSFTAVSAAERAGGDVKALVEKLDQAARLVDSGKPGDLADAERLLSEVNAAVPQIKLSGEQRITTRYVATGLALLILGGAALWVWFRGADAWWRLWLRTKTGWRVERA